MNAVPKRFSPSDIKNFESYCCPISGSLAYSENAPDRWVYCPMVENPICYGACLDIQSIARDDNFDLHPFVDEFYKISENLKIDVLNLRKICLTHQQEILQNSISDKSSLENKKLVKELLDWVNKIKLSLSKTSRK